MGFLGKFWARVRGFFIRAGDDVVSSSPEAIRATYATAIDEAKRRYKDMEKAVALLARERERTEIMIQDINGEEAEIKRKLEGALAAAESDPNNPSHREAGTRYLTRLEEIDQKRVKLTSDLDTQKINVEEYKLRLRSFTEEIDRLKREQGEMVAEFVSNIQIIQLEDRLKGLAESAVDESIVAIRDKVANLRSQATIAAEMRGAALESHDVAYERIGSEKLAQAKFDELLKSRADTKAGVPDKERDLG